MADAPDGAGMRGFAALSWLQQMLCGGQE